MIQTLRLLLLFIYFNFLYSSYSCNDTNSPYIIYTSEEFSESANVLYEFHRNEMPPNCQLNTIIKYKENLDEDDFINYLTQFKDDTKYLIIIGDETIIPPILIDDNVCNIVEITDDKFNEEFIIGRLIVNSNEEALNQINRIKEYLLNTSEGTWKNELLLIADNDNNPESPSSNSEIKHTRYTSKIFDTMENSMLVHPLYGIEYPIEYSPAGESQPAFTNSIINKINSGAGIINYIGHGSPEDLAHELILQLDRDIDLINTNNKPPVWVVGTCSFGQYNNNVCMAEELLKTSDGAIAIIATTEGIPVSANSNYITEFYNLVNAYILDNNNFRLGEIFKKAKENNLGNCYQYTFQLFGDPAMPLIQSKKSNSNDIFNNMDVSIGSENYVNSNLSGRSYIKVLGETINNEVIKDSFSSALSCVNNEGFWDLNNNYCIFEYNKSGPTLFESTFYNDISFFIPLETNPNQTGKIVIFNENSLLSQFETTNFILNIDQNIFNDNIGPNIQMFHNEALLTHNSTLHPPYKLKFYFSDEHPLNLSGINNHYLRFWIDNEKNSIILNEYFSSIDDVSGTVEIIIDEDKFKPKNSYNLNVEAWDILNNQNKISYKINISDSNDNVYNVYNFPNPFNEKTFFTFQMNKPEPIKVIIDIFSKNLKKLKTIHYSSNDLKSYHALPNNGWAGLDENNNYLKNGTYFYSLKIKSKNSNKTLHQGLYNITILK